MNTKDFFKSSLWITGFTFVGKALGFFREMLLAAKFGTGFTSDLIVYILSMDTILFMAIAMALPNIIVPMIVECEKERKSPYIALLKVVGIIGIVALLFLGVGSFSPSTFIKFFAPGMYLSCSLEELHILENCTKIFLISNFFIGISYTCVGFLQAKKHYKIVSGISVIYNVVIIGGIELVSQKEVNAFSIVVVLVFAYFIQMVLAVGIVVGDWIKDRGKFSDYSFSIKPYILLFVPVIVSTSVQQLNYFFDKRVVSYCGQGELTLLHYGYKISSFAYSISITIISSILYPIIVENIKNDSSDISYKKKTFELSNILLVSFCWMMVNNYYITDVLFGHGKFNEQNVFSMARIMFLYLPGMLLMTIREIYIKVSYANNNSKTPMMFTMLTVALNILLDYCLVDIWGTRGVAFATSLSVGITFLPFVLIINKRYMGSFVLLNARNFLFMILMCLLIVVFEIVLAKYSLPFVGKIIYLALSFVVPTGLYYMYALKPQND